MPNMTGRPGCRTMEWREEVPRRISLAPFAFPFLCTWFNRGGSRRAFRLPGEGGDHIYCTVEPLPGHSRCRKMRNFLHHQKSLANGDFLCDSTISTSPRAITTTQTDIFSGLQTYPNLYPPPPVGPPLGCFPRGGANLCRFVPVRCSQTRASGRQFVHVRFGLLGRLVQVGANLGGFGALWHLMQHLHCAFIVALLSATVGKAL